MFISIAVSSFRRKYSKALSYAVKDRRTDKDNNYISYATKNE